MPKQPDFTELDKTLAESEPRAKSRALGLSAQRIGGLISRIDTAITYGSMMPP